MIKLYQKTIKRNLKVLDGLVVSLMDIIWLILLMLQTSFINFIKYNFNRANRSRYPFAIIGKTYKGRNYGKDVENNMAYHGKPLGDKADEAI